MFCACVCVCQGHTCAVADRIRKSSELHTGGHVRGKGARHLRVGTPSISASLGGKPADRGSKGLGHMCSCPSESLCLGTRCINPSCWRNVKTSLLAPEIAIAKPGTHPAAENDIKLANICRKLAACQPSWLSQGTRSLPVTAWTELNHVAYDGVAQSGLVLYHIVAPFAPGCQGLQIQTLGVHDVCFPSRQRALVSYQLIGSNSTQLVSHGVCCAWHIEMPVLPGQTDSTSLLVSHGKGELVD